MFADSSPQDMEAFKALCTPDEIFNLTQALDRFIGAFLEVDKILPIEGRPPEVARVIAVAKEVGRFVNHVEAPAGPAVAMPSKV